jgi:dihydroorotate dehydrogenase
VLDLAYRAALPLLFRLDAEDAHQLVLSLLRVAGPYLPRGRAAGRPVDAFGLRFPNPIGLAAGLDKNALALAAWRWLGFGHVEVGTVTPRPQAGNPRPRVFRLPADCALINRMGFPNDGAAAVAGRLARRPAGLIVGGNVGKGRETPLERAADDYAAAALALEPRVDYLAVNVSSPNTAGLRLLQAPAHAAEIVARVRALTAKPILLKLAPDLDLAALPEIVAAARGAGASGLIATNTTSARDGLAAAATIAAEQSGGLSGRPLRARALRFTERLAEVAGPDLPVISAGGIATPDDVRDRLAAGARLVQLYTALIYEGPGLPGRLAERDDLG